MLERLSYRSTRDTRDLLVCRWKSRAPECLQVFFCTAASRSPLDIDSNRRSRASRICCTRRRRNDRARSVSSRRCRRPNERSPSVDRRHIRGEDAHSSPRRRRAREVAREDTRAQDVQSAIKINNNSRNGYLIAADNRRHESRCRLQSATPTCSC